MRSGMRGIAGQFFELFKNKRGMSATFLFSVRTHLRAPAKNYERHDNQKRTCYDKYVPFIPTFFHGNIHGIPPDEWLYALGQKDLR